ncbi:MAG: folate family ECF transporter S component [Solobacterium sp.]|nr:folate family ECF transporter S component [Solobacterium sp.]
MKNTTKKLTMLALLTALEIILSRFLSISAWNIKIGFSFVPVVIAGILYGPLEAGAVGALGDLLGALLFPIGPYFPGFTLTAFLSGLVFGFFLHKEISVRNTLIAVLIHQFVLGLLLNTFWISVLYESPFLPLLATRSIQSVILAVVEFLVIQAMKRFPKGFLKQVSA